MRYELVDHKGRVLGELVLADGVRPAEAGAALLQGRPMQLRSVQAAEAGERAAATAAAAEGRRVAAK